MLAPERRIEARDRMDFGQDAAWERLERARAALVEHPVHAAIGDLPALRCFMEHHVFAVWDFMCLLKRLQIDLTTVRLPWVPPSDAAAARLVNEIVLGEETDRLADGRVISHFELYLAAMREVGADTGPITSFIEAVRGGTDPRQALHLAPEGARAFVLVTLGFVEGPIAHAAAAFVFGREEVLPSLFERMLHHLRERGVSCPALATYLERHIEVDGQDHGPLARQLFLTLCRGDSEAVRSGIEAGERAIAARQAFWSAIRSALPHRG